MAKSSDWLPGSRTGQLEMGRKWLDYITPQKMTAWNIPQAVITKLENLWEAADGILREAASFDRTTAQNSRIRTAFGELTDHMRDTKKRYFYIPPLLEADLYELGLRPHDSTPTPVGPPTSVVTATFFYPHANSLGLNIIPVQGSNYDDRAEWGFRIYYGVMPQGGATPEQAMERQYLMRPPERGEELTQSHFTRRKKDILEFDYNNSAMTCFVCIRYENGKGDKGPWGPIVSAVVP